MASLLSWSRVGKADDTPASKQQDLLQGNPTNAGAEGCSVTSGPPGGSKDGKNRHREGACCGRRGRFTEARWAVTGRSSIVSIHRQGHHGSAGGRPGVARGYPGARPPHHPLSATVLSPGPYRRLWPWTATSLFPPCQQQGTGFKEFSGSGLREFRNPGYRGTAASALGYYKLPEAAL